MYLVKYSGQDSKQLKIIMIKSHEEIIIYESPDGDKTVYSRKSGSSDLSMIKEDTSQSYITKWYEWKEILKLAETEPALANAINKAEMIYKLVKKET
jgi:hypothetical protein